MKYRFGFVGAGNMASAIIETISNLDYIKPEDIYIYDVDPEKIEKFTKCGMKRSDSYNDLFKKCDFVFICVKPQVFKTNAEIFKIDNSDVKCIVTIMAGITIENVKKTIGNYPVIRIMPNTPMLVGEGASALVKESDVPDQIFNIVFDIFNSCGTAVVVSEDNISAVTALSGSGPAYFFKFARAAIKEAVSEGLNESDALSLLCQTMTGSAKMLENSGKSADELIDMVTSPGGTTLAASVSFDNDDFEGSISRAMLACRNRADELGKDL